MSSASYHIFRDPVHGYIRVSDLEKAIIDTLAFQRLRNIRQLGLTSLVYHGAVHTRFEHSIGVMECATRVFDTLFHRFGETFKDKLGGFRSPELLRQRLRLAALLHDLGHGPFSHASDEIFPEGESHESYSAKLTQATEMAEVLSKSAEQFGGVSELLDLMSKTPLGENAFLRSIIVGELDADRMDYLLRDSLYAGVSYGKFDLDRLIETLCVVEDASGSLVLGIEERGKHAAELMILARYFMFTQVYFHPVRRAYDYHLGQLFREVLPDGRLPSDPADFVRWDDIEVLSKARELDSASARRVLRRQHFECVYETGEHPEADEVDGLRDRFDNAQSRFPGQVHRDVARNAPYYYREPRELRMVRRNGGITVFWEESPLVKNLPRIHQQRIYADPAVAGQVIAVLRG